MPEGAWQQLHGTRPATTTLHACHTRMQVASMHPDTCGHTRHMKIFTHDLITRHNSHTWSGREGVWVHTLQTAVTATHSMVYTGTHDTGIASLLGKYSPTVCTQNASFHDTPPTPQSHSRTAPQGLLGGGDMVGLLPPPVVPPELPALLLLPLRWNK